MACALCSFLCIWKKSEARYAWIPNVVTEVFPSQYLRSGTVTVLYVQEVAVPRGQPVFGTIFFARKFHLDDVQTASTHSWRSVLQKRSSVQVLYCSNRFIPTLANYWAICYNHHLKVANKHYSKRGLAPNQNQNVSEYTFVFQLSGG